jgi:hypothetical protein
MKHVEHCALWAQRVSAEEWNNLTPSDHLNLTLIFSLCDAISPRLGRLVRRTLHEATDRIAHLSYDSLFECDGVAVLMCMLIQHRLGRSPGEGYISFAELAAQALHDAETCSDASLRAALFPSQFLLNRLGLCAEPAKIACKWPPCSELLTANTETLRSQTRMVAAAAVFGQERVSAPEGIIKILEATSLTVLQDYDVDLASELLRTLVYVGRSDSQAVEYSRQFILANQECDGDFGLLSFDEPQSLRPAQPFETLMQRKIAASLLSLWTLAETAASPVFLFHHLERRNGPHYDPRLQ